MRHPPQAIIAYSSPAERAAGPATWEILNADSASALSTYTIVQEYVAGPFGTELVDAMEQAKLKYLGYESLLAGLAEKFHSSAKLLQTLNPG